MNFWDLRYGRLCQNVHKALLVLSKSCTGVLFLPEFVAFSCFTFHSDATFSTSCLELRATQKLTLQAPKTIQGGGVKFVHDYEIHTRPATQRTTH